MKNKLMTIMTVLIIICALTLAFAGCAGGEGEKDDFDNGVLPPSAVFAVRRLFIGLYMNKRLYQIFARQLVFLRLVQKLKDALLLRSVLRLLNRKLLTTFYWCR